jgi:hypothetical protein
MEHNVPAVSDIFNQYYSKKDTDNNRNNYQNEKNNK